MDNEAVFAILQHHRGFEIKQSRFDQSAEFQLNLGGLTKGDLLMKNYTHFIQIISTCRLLNVCAQTIIIVNISVEIED